MSELFKIFIDRLREGQVQKIEEIFQPSFFQIDEPELLFRSPVAVKGDAYLTDSELIIRLQAKTFSSIPCAACNQMVEVELKIENYYHAIPLTEIRSGVFDFSESLREDLLLELPKYVECNRGRCPERASLTPFLRPQSPQEKTTYFPFSDMETK